MSRAVLRPFEQFIHVQAASGILLLVAAAAALIWANTHGSSYHALWETRLTASVGGWAIEVTLHRVVNDLLMAVFFFVIGLEVRRELHTGVLSTARQAALPIVAAVGGMIVPAGIYLLMAPAEARSGWGVPMSTDTAFALGVLALLGSRIAPTLRVLLLAIAIIDDVAAILIIAVFYTSGIDWRGIAVAVAALGAIVGLQRLGVRHVAGYAVPAIAVWCGCVWAGIHPTVAGVLVGLATPARIWYGQAGFLDAAYRHLDTIAGRLQRAEHRPHDTARSMSALRRAQRETVSPADRVQDALHAWAAFLIMPLFALANAGLGLARVDLSAAPGLVVGVVCGLVVGKLAGIVLATTVAAKLRLVSLPPDVTWRGIVVIAAVAGVGFTMALFIADLAFRGEPELRDVATGAVLMASAVAAVLALVLGRLALPPRAACEDPTPARGPRTSAASST